MLDKRISVFICVHLWLLTQAFGAIKAGTAKVDITPPASITMWGYGDRKGPAEGTRDPLWARVLVLDEGTTPVALVTLDLGRTFGPAQMDWVRQRVRPVQVVFTASHTHSGPVIDEAYPDGRAPDWEQKALEGIATAIKRAYDARMEARVGSGWSVAYLGHDRRYTRFDGSVLMLWGNPAGVPTYPVDPTVAILRVDDAAGKPLAILVNYACHPVVFGPDNLRYSADFPGAMRNYVESHLGGMAFFLQGAPGDINPYKDKTPLIEDAAGEMTRAGEALGRAVVQVAAGIVTRPLPDARIGLHVDTMHFRLRYDERQIRATLASLPPRYQDYVKPEYYLPVTSLTIGDQVAFVGMPGEPFVRFQMDLRSRAPAPFTFFLGYTNGYYGYFPGIREAVAGGYGASGLPTWVEVGAGERMLDRAIINIYRLLGKLSDQPEKPQ